MIILLNEKKGVWINDEEQKLLNRGWVKNPSGMFSNTNYPFGRDFETAKSIQKYEDDLSMENLRMKSKLAEKKSSVIVYKKNPDNIEIFPDWMIGVIVGFALGFLFRCII